MYEIGFKQVRRRKVRPMFSRISPKSSTYIKDSTELHPTYFVKPEFIPLHHTKTRNLTYADMNAYKEGLVEGFNF
jgi:hypothetical protein